MNVIGMCKDIFTCSDLPEYGILSEIFKGIDARDRKSIHGFARVNGTAPIHIPARTVVVIPCTGPQVDGGRFDRAVVRWIAFTQTLSVSANICNCK